MSVAIVAAMMAAVSCGNNNKKAEEKKAECTEQCCGECETKIMPITNANQVERAIKLSGSFMPQRFKSLVDKFGSDPEAMKQAGIIYASDQIIDLYANGITNVHVYSMNKPDVAEGILKNAISQSCSTSSLVSERMGFSPIP